MTAAQKHTNLVEASSKFSFMARLLPKLIASGHRMLIFTQFLSVLDLLERFLEGMKLKFARLDGGTQQSERQEAIDLFNRKDSPLSCFILSTRAGGGASFSSRSYLTLTLISWYKFDGKPAVFSVASLVHSCLRFRLP